MRINSSVPKTFIIFTRKGDHEGYVRYFSNESPDGKIKFKCRIVSSKKDGSKFVNKVIAKELASKIKEKYQFDYIKVVDFDAVRKVKKQAKK